MYVYTYIYVCTKCSKNWVKAQRKISEKLINEIFVVFYGFFLQNELLLKIRLHY